jgi:hypothetical protein
MSTSRCCRDGVARFELNRHHSGAVCLGPGFPIQSARARSSLGSGGPSKLIPAKVPRPGGRRSDVDEQLDCLDQIEGQSLAADFTCVSPRPRADETSRRSDRQPVERYGATASAGLWGAPSRSHRRFDRQKPLSVCSAPRMLRYSALTFRSSRSCRVMSLPWRLREFAAARLGRYADAPEQETVDADLADKVSGLTQGLWSPWRGVGLLATFFPDGSMAPGWSTRWRSAWSPFNTGLQLDPSPPTAPKSLELNAGRFALARMRGGLRNLDNGFRSSPRVPLSGWACWWERSGVRVASTRRTSLAGGRHQCGSQIAEVTASVVR